MAKRHTPGAAGGVGITLPETASAEGIRNQSGCIEWPLTGSLNCRSRPTPDGQCFEKRTFNVSLVNRAAPRAPSAARAWWAAPAYCQQGKREKVGTRDAVTGA